jgi:hypothetical protein
MPTSLPEKSYGEKFLVGQTHPYVNRFIMLEQRTLLPDRDSSAQHNRDKSKPLHNSSSSYMKWG